jgi:hypothetical protein
MAGSGRFRAKIRGAHASLVCALLLSLLPLLICVVQTTTKHRQLVKLKSLEGHPLEETSYFSAARTTISALRPAGTGVDYLAPLLFYSVLLMFGFGLILFGYFSQAYFGAPNPILAGMRFGPWDWQNPNPVISDYQRGTFVVMAAAFIGSYVYCLGRLADRVNNNDLYPISLHYYAARMIIAFFTAAVFRHVASLAGKGFHDTEALILIGFVAGLAPDLMLIWLARKGFERLKSWHDRREPEEKYRPSSFPLMVIDDLTKEKVERFSELGIDSAQVLACQNPFLLWTRLPYDLGLLTDWIAQAQLYAFARDKGLQKLREICVNDIFDFYQRLASVECAPAVCAAVNVDSNCAGVLLEQLETDQSFARLKEVRDALSLKRPAVG